MTERRATVLVASTRAAHGVYEDRTGPVIEAWLDERGFTTERVIAADGRGVPRIRARP